MRRTAAHIALALMLFAAQGVHALHPLLHARQDSCPACHQRPAAQAETVAQALQARDEAGQPSCPICAWLTSSRGQGLCRPVAPPGLAVWPRALQAGQTRPPLQAAAPVFDSRGPPPSPQA